MGVCADDIETDKTSFDELEEHFRKISRSLAQPRGTSCLDDLDGLDEVELTLV